MAGGCPRCDDRSPLINSPDDHLYWAERRQAHPPRERLRGETVRASASMPASIAFSQT
jgi:hypothetical protein